MKTISASILLPILLCGGCTNNTTTSPTAVTSPVSSATPKVSATPAAAPNDGGLHGVIAERADVSSYTYFRITTAKGDVWAAVPTNPTKVGTEVTIVNAMPMQSFKSKALNKTFDIIYFGAGVEVAGATPPSPVAVNPHGKPSGSPHGTSPHSGMAQTTPAVDLSKIKVSKAPGPDGHSVAEVFKDKVALTDKKVSVHGKVVKVTEGVLGRNWLHIRDGSGSDATKDNDLVVTTTDEVAPNDEITINGVVHRDKDLGSGYAYDVLIEDAKVSR